VIFLPAANCPIHPRDLILPERIGVRARFDPLTAQIENNAIICIKGFGFLELIANRLAEFDLGFSCLWLLQDDIDKL